MKGNERLLESRDASGAVLELLENARGPRPLDAATRARSRRRLAAVSAVPAAAGVMFWLQKVALAGLLGAAAGGAVLAPQWLASPPTAKEPRTVAPNRSVQSAPRPPAPSGHVREDLASEAPRVPQVSAAPTTFAAPSAPVLTPNVVREAQLLEHARGLLATNPSAALRALSRHEREFRAGTLLVEREFLRVDALVRLGRTAEARERARSLQRLAPGHLYEQRLKSVLGPEF